MAAQTPIGSTKIPLALPFGTLGVGNAAGTLYPVPNDSVIAEYTMPQSGSIVGFSVNLTGTLMTGTLSFTPTKNGVAMTQFANGTINIGTQSTFQRVQSQQGIYSFNAGDTVGLSFEKTGTVAPTTRNMNALLLILLENYDY